MEELYILYNYVLGLLSNPKELFLSVFVVVLLVETPYTFFIFLSVLGSYFHQLITPNKKEPYYPKVSCIITAYSEGKDILITLKSLEEQFYKGHIEVLVMIDGADVNKETLDVAMNYKKTFESNRKRTLKVVPKWQRGGHASSSNLGFRLSTGDLVILLDGDTSVDNDMVSNMVQPFADPDVIGCSGTIRVRNIKKNILTKCQGIEYMLGIQMSKIALSNINSVNNISGAFGCFRRTLLKKTTLWRNGSAEDLDMTLRLQFLFKRHKNLKIKHVPYSVSHTDAPESVWVLIKQRMRWDGDTYFIYIRRHLKRLLPRYLGWKTFFVTLFSGLFFHAVQPIVIVISLIYTAFMFPVHVIVPVYVAVYIYYLVLNFALFITFILLVSERKKEDAKLWYVLFVMPFYSVFLKFVATVATFSEFFIKSHKDSTMAPTWVNKKVG
ncbi:glycosyltransferase family 2 protein [Francisella adeliensis]|uniref:Glycosyl transferase n=1 Tax=Francisella adeliensis TaxID=2007306 RepID=A0A2Z4XXS8_9GAMM|nr:glycosyltransferase [Francisella adeliensis]AXA33223.1 glycosyl transferase [Francisella adeliensis]MBK2085056.1 glycosyltransferase family 2 protein [Francisella adeliensis]MBK2096953.1 glycosyltransferase family 2 protein [Francisella adeliensis]QIW11451.1 glycosyltransferase family 2 protein [Francisella adeliensis]QIW13326.1 glycosyltransferase family 2 protein [Francisella adeliensis]